MWSVTQTLLAISAAAVVGSFCSLTIPYLVFGNFHTIFGINVTAEVAFAAMWAFRYWRLIVHLVSYLLYRPYSHPMDPELIPRDVTVILPTVQPSGDVFLRCCETVCRPRPAAFYIVVGRNSQLVQAEEVCCSPRRQYPDIHIVARSSGSPGKRIQVAHVIPFINTKITILVDDHVFWPERFFVSILAPFHHDPSIALVGTNKRVTLDEGASPFAAYWNLLGATYLERHNFEIVATSSIDGGIFAVSGRTSAIRTSVLQAPDFLPRYLSETIGLCPGLRFTHEPLGPDDDNFITRYVMTMTALDAETDKYKSKSKGLLRVVIQSEPSACIETPLGSYPKFLHTCLRWARTTFRSNAASLRSRDVWASQPWSVYGVYLAGVTNFALANDVLLAWLLARTRACARRPVEVMGSLVAWMLLTKMVKVAPYFYRNPRHIVFFPLYIFFGYWHSCLKLVSLLTFWDASWSGRTAEELAGESVKE
ncbi:hypothetical protein BX600DRAFT_501858 [Xylariales sp. PMI_506]|nr:hypothetical protein BX600DRAFT_501858 [Xylariales sp. PMI_506]